MFINYIVCVEEVNNMIRGFKVKLHPTESQKILMLKSLFLISLFQKITKH